ARLDLDGLSSNDVVFGYGAEIIQNSQFSADLRIVRFWNDDREVLGTQSISDYAASAPLVLRFRSKGNTLSADAVRFGETDPIATLSVTDSVFKKPGRVGIYGETGGSGQRVFV